jgi:hypothetical protein
MMENDGAAQCGIAMHLDSEKGFTPGAFLIFKSETKFRTTTTK